MSELDPTETRLREELRAIDTPVVDVVGLLAAGRRRARRRAVRRGSVAGAGVAGLAAATVAIAVLPRDRADTVIGSHPQAPSTPPAVPATTRPAEDVIRGKGTTWPGGPFDPIDGMVPVPGRTLLSDAQSSEIYDAENRLIGACMARQGFERDTTAGGEPVGAPPLYLSPAELRAGGFDYEYDWAAAGEEFLGNSDGGTSYTEGMTAEELAAYDAALLGTSPEPGVEITTHDGTSGTSSEGCAGEARAQLYGSVANSLRYNDLTEPFSDLGGQLRAHDEYQQPLADWQACMGAAGFDVGDHDYGADYIRQQGAVALSEHGREQTQFTAESIPAIAEADADCQESSGLYEVRQSLLAGITREIAADLGVDFDHYVAYEHALYERAKQVP
jgi:hypothetical protein